MVSQVQFRRGTTAQHASFTGANGEITIDTDKDTVVVHDGTTAGGFPLQTTAGLSGNVAILTANNTSFVGSVSAANVVSNAQLSANLGNYQTTAGLNANIASYLPTYTGVVNGSSITVGSSWTANTTGVYHTGTINAASHTVGSSFIANATGVYHTGTINAASHTVGSSFIANTSQLTVSGIPLSANGGTGTAGQIFYSNGATGSPYWAAAPSVIGNNGIVSNSSGIFVNANTGLVANTSGLFVNATYIGTLSANNASFLGGTAAASYQLNSTLSANVATLTSNNTTYVNGKTEGNLNVNNAVYFNGTSSSSYVLLAGNQTFTGGFAVTAYNIGTVSSGTTTPAPSNGNYQYLTNNGAFTLANPASDCAIDILVTNGASAGTITFTGFTVPTGGGGDTYATTNAQKYILMIRRIAGTSTYVWKALQ